ncbi:MAG TPA: hypothetical protein VL137_01450, partial [Polyangiaceae bacterium]|nr:hypothetical protein [Polyangiaceae bacterium]
MHCGFWRNASLVVLLALSGSGCDRALKTSGDAGANGVHNADSSAPDISAGGARNVAGASGAIAGAGTSAGGGVGSSAGANMGGSAGGPPCTTIPFVDQLSPSDVPAPECPSTDFDVQTDIAYAPGPAHLLDLRLP